MTSRKRYAKLTNGEDDMENPTNELYYAPENDGRFDANALYAALDEHRRYRGITWQQVAEEMGISPSTIMFMDSEVRLDVDEILAMVRWLGRHVESFTRGRTKIHF
jgi:DNA-binding XRE family transcriptional regulator